jgi:hypothetical protein
MADIKQKIGFEGPETDGRGYESLEREFEEV